MYFTPNPLVKKTDSNTCLSLYFYYYIFMLALWCTCYCFDNNWIMRTLFLVALYACNVPGLRLQFYELQEFIFRKFTWFVPAEENLDNISSKIRAVAPQHPAADLLVFLVICGLFFTFMILSTNFPKSEASRYDINNIET